LECIEQQQPTNVHFQLNGNTLQIRLDEVATEPIAVSVYTTSGMLLSKTTLPKGCTQQEIDLLECSKGVYIIDLKSSDSTMRGSTLIRI